MHGMSPFGDAVRERIRSFRKSKRLSQASVAERMGVSSQHVHSLEAGKRRLTLEWIESIASALDLRPEDLLLGGESESVEESSRTLLPSRGTDRRRNLINLVEAEKLSMSQLASMLGVTTKIATEMIAGSRPIHIEQIPVIAAWLQLDDIDVLQLALGQIKIERIGLPATMRLYQKAFEIAELVIARNQELEAPDSPTKMARIIASYIVSSDGRDLEALDHSLHARLERQGSEVSEEQEEGADKANSQ